MGEKEDRKRKSIKMIERATREEKYRVKIGMISSPIYQYEKVVSSKIKTTTGTSIVLIITKYDNAVTTKIRQAEHRCKDIKSRRRN